ncbi:MAG TPA: 30S ribosome-binding factor RbfA [Clostridia bacterium]|nr:30S ribosome-binding factor RbfA [Clostridia bacterium]
MSYRSERLAETVKKEVSDIITTTIKDPRVGFASITSVEVSGDLRHAKIFVSVLGPDNEKEATLEALEHAKGFIRTELGRRVRLRHTPELIFYLDDSIGHGVRVMELLKAVKAESEGKDND